MATTGLQADGLNTEQSRFLPRLLNMRTAKKSNYGYGTAILDQSQFGSAAHHYAGEERIMIESNYSATISDASINPTRFLQDYEKLVQRISATVKSDPAFDPKKPESFIRSCFNAMSVSEGIKYGLNRNGFMTESLKDNCFNSNTSVFLTLDVAKELGITSAKAVSTGNNFLLKVSDLYFETTTGGALTEAQFHAVYPGTASVTSDPDELQAITINNVGVTALSSTNIWTASTYFSEAMQVWPAYAPAYKHFESSRKNDINYLEEIGIYMDLIKKDPCNALPYYYCADVRLAFGDMPGALADLREAIKLAPENVQYRLRRAELHLYLMDYQSAESDFSRSLELDPFSSAAYLGLGDAKFASGNFDSAVEDYTSGLILTNTHRHLFLNGRAKARYKQRDFLGALGDYIRAATDRVRSIFPRMWGRKRFH